jgi:hypothetical protein
MERSEWDHGARTFLSAQGVNGFECANKFEMKAMPALPSYFECLAPFSPTLSLFRQVREGGEQEHERQWEEVYEKDNSGSGFDGVTGTG